MYGPPQLYIDYTDANGLEQQQFLPMYPMSAKFVSAVSNLKLFLDKARLKEIDPTLQWHDDELAHAMFEGANYINGYPSAVTFWTVDTFPFSLSTYLWYAAALYALNSRYLAEGFTAFQFSGLSTNLEVDRRDAIVYKIEELKGFLETNLTKAKAAAIKTFGIGETPATVETANNLGVLGLSTSHVNNTVDRHGRYGRNHFTTRW